MNTPQLPFPRLDALQPRGSISDSLCVMTDEALFVQCGVRVAFTGREGGVSDGVYQSLNLAMHVDDDPDAVRENRARVMDALGAASLPLLCARQVHGTDLVFVNDATQQALAVAQESADAGADGFVITVTDVAALLCFADCVSVAIVSPTGAFALVHAGWRGAASSIASKAASALATYDSQGESAAFKTPKKALAAYNVYIGPYIHGECFEVGKDVYDSLCAVGGTDCALDARHVDLGRVIINDLVRTGIAPVRIADAGVCTSCHVESFYSYRAEGGTCGRHGLIAFRKGAG